jgi:hypothetical protein
MFPIASFFFTGKALTLFQVNFDFKEVIGDRIGLPIHYEGVYIVS